MTKEEFTDEIRGLLEAFPALKNRYKLSRIYEIMSDLPLDVLSKIIMTIGDEAKSCPSINDFKNETSRWKRSYFAKHGRYWGQEEAVVANDFECKQCIDSGIVELHSNYDQTFAFQMRCNCDTGKRSFAKLPIVESNLKQGFNFRAPDLENFKPSSGEFADFMSKAKKWFKKVAESEKHFEQLGYEHKINLNER